jgi:hypothetical protein
VPAPIVIENPHPGSYYREDSLNPVPGVGQFRYVKTYDEEPTPEETDRDFRAWKKAQDAA